MTIKNNKPSNEYFIQLEKELKYVEHKQEAGKRNIKLMIYPLLASFALLGGYGFYLIQSLATDVGKMSTTVLMMSNSISKNIETISVTAKSMSGNMKKMTGTVNTMSRSTKEISGSMTTMNLTVTDLQIPLDDINASTQRMQFDARGLNQNISKPLEMFNRFIP